ncbi:hypothetical protein TNCV_3263641 [Trichonephila clavipes]|nr:hypothetical protein TNCV_3263641 [Trichonephila clavipes]
MKIICHGKEKGLYFYKCGSQRRSYRRINRIDAKGHPQAKGAPTCVTTVPLARLPHLKKGFEGILIQGPLRASYTSDGRAK